MFTYLLSPQLCEMPLPHSRDSVTLFSTFLCLHNILQTAGENITKFTTKVRWGTGLGFEITGSVFKVTTRANVVRIVCRKCTFPATACRRMVCCQRPSVLVYNTNNSNFVHVCDTGQADT